MPSFRGGPLIAAVLIVGSAVTFYDVVGPLRLDVVHHVASAFLILLAAFRAGTWLSWRDRGREPGSSGSNNCPEEKIAIGILLLSLIPLVLSLLWKITAASIGIPVLLLAIIPTRGRDPGGGTQGEGPRGRDLPASRFPLPAPSHRGMISCARYKCTIVETFKNLCRQIEMTVSRSGPFGMIYFFLGALGLLWALCSTFAPPTGMDALTYHFGLGVQYLARGNLIPPDAVAYYQYTQSGEMIALLGLALDSSGIASSMLLGMFLPLAALAAARMAGEIRRLQGGDEGNVALARTIAFSATATLPLCAILVAHSKTDVLALALLILGVRRLLPSTESHGRAAFLLGGSIAVKLTAVYGVVPAMIYMAWRRRKNLGSLWRMGARFLAMPAYWLGSNLIRFGSIVPRSAHVAEAVTGHAGAPIVERFARIFGGAFLFISQGIDGPYGPAAAALFIAALVSAMNATLSGRRRPKTDCDSSAYVPGMIAAGALLLWLVTGGGSHGYARGGLLRFLLPSMGPAIAGGSAYLAAMLSRITSTGISGCVESSSRAPTGGRPYDDQNARAVHQRGFLIAIALAVALAVSLISSVKILEQYHGFLPFLTGRITQAEYMARWISSYELQRRAAESLPPDAKVLSVGEAKLFYLNRDARFDIEADRPRVYEVIHPEGGSSDSIQQYKAFANWMEKERFTHVLHAPDVYARNILEGLALEPRSYDDRAVFENFLKQNASLIISDDTNHVYLYEIKRTR